MTIMTWKKHSIAHLTKKIEKDGGLLWSTDRCFATDDDNYDHDDDLDDDDDDDNIPVSSSLQFLSFRARRSQGQSCFDNRRLVRQVAALSGLCRSRTSVWSASRSGGRPSKNCAFLTSDSTKTKWNNWLIILGLVDKYVFKDIASHNCTKDIRLFKLANQCSMIVLAFVSF